MKISFDFDDTLSEKYIQVIASALVGANHDVWIISARCNLDKDIIEVCENLKIDINKVILTNGNFKWKYYFNNNIDLHFDDNWEEVNLINNKGGKSILINPDFEDIFSLMQYKNGQRRFN